MLQCNPTSAIRENALTQIRQSVFPALIGAAGFGASSFDESREISVSKMRVARCTIDQFEIMFS